LSTDPGLLKEIEMTTIPRVRRDLRAETVADEAVFLLSERSERVLEDPLARRVLPLLDGKNSVDDVLDLIDDVPAEQVLYLIDRLLGEQVLVRADPEIPLREAAFWDMDGVGAETALNRLAAAVVEVAVVGEVDPAGVVDGLRRAGIGQVRPGPSSGAGSADLLVVLTNDYLRAELADHNRAAIAAGRPWLLAKPVGSTLWVGPTFRPGATACWACLRQRLSGHRQVVEYVQRRSGRPDQLTLPLADLGITRDLAAHWVSLAAVTFLATADNGDGPTRGDHLLTFDTLALDAQRHPVQRRPQCPACGDAGLVARLVEAPVRLESRPKRYVGDGGHRAQPPDDLVRRFQPFVSPVSGVVRTMIPFDVAGGFAKGYYAGHNFALRSTRLHHLRAGLRTLAAGKGTTDAQARASVIGEAIERYSGVYCGDEPHRTASLLELGELAIAPNECQLFSQHQYDNRQAWNLAQRSSFQLVCDPLPADQRIDWTPVWSLTQDRARYVPTSYLYYHHPRVEGEFFASGDSNGNAAGASLEDAVLQGFLELVERDSVALWWYNRVQRPAFDLDRFGEPWFDEFREVYTGLGREVWVLDITSDLGIPAAAAVSRRIDKPAEDILMGFGAHLDPKLAIQRALSEINQFLPAVVAVDASGAGYAYEDEIQLAWWRGARLAEQPHLAPKTGPASGPGTYRNLSTMDLRDDVRVAQALIESHGMELLVLDQTRPDIELPVVKVIVPGLRHMWGRFGPGRLYDVPVELGWLDTPTPESELNPILMFL
jgi:oxazoline/thiazoline synthase